MGRSININGRNEPIYDISVDYLRLADKEDTFNNHYQFILKPRPRSEFQIEHIFEQGKLGQVLFQRNF